METNTSTSLVKIESNRRNALNSTGPRTRKGRGISRRNSLRHGILAKQVLVRGGHIRENPREFALLHRDLTHDLNPVGAAEEMLVEEIVTGHWRLQRARRAEAATLSLQIDQNRRARGRLHDMERLLWRSQSDPLRAMQGCADGLGTLAVWLGDLHHTVWQHGELTEAALDDFAEKFAGKPNALIGQLRQLRLQSNPGAAEPEAAKAERKKAVLEFLESEIRITRDICRSCAESEEREEETRQTADALPSPQLLDRLLRYETKLERQIQNAMTQLERLQRMRCGEAIPAPLTLQVTTEAADEIRVEKRVLGEGSKS